MELQLFNEQGALCLRVNDGEPLWRVLTDVLPGNPGQDIPLGHGQLVALAEKVRQVLRNRLDAILPIGSPEYDSTPVVILGESIALRVRNPRHHEVKRINSLYECLAGLAESGQSTVLFAVPDLSSVDHVIATVIDSGAGLGLAELTARTVDRFTELANATTDTDVRDGLCKLAGTIDEMAVAERSDRLVSWGLLERGPQDLLFATAKLRSVVH
jgi:hypothetical protein